MLETKLKLFWSDLSYSEFSAWDFRISRIYIENSFLPEVSISIFHSRDVQRNTVEHLIRNLFDRYWPIFSSNSWSNHQKLTKQRLLSVLFMYYTDTIQVSFLQVAESGLILHNTRKTKKARLSANISKTGPLN